MVLKWFNETYIDQMEANIKFQMVKHQRFLKLLNSWIAIEEKTYNARKGAQTQIIVNEKIEDSFIVIQN